MLMFNSELKTVTTNAPSTSNACFVYEQKNRNTWLLMEDTLDHGNAIDVHLRIWGMLPGRDSSEAPTWWIIDEFTVATDGAVGQFLSYPLSFYYVYVQEITGGTTHIKCKMVSDDKLGGS